ncbi:hypothetical protein PWG15_09005 [Ensifer adhaerens]|uniref:DUF4274 domain-containing protein n=1 Tax=Ensifer adhaerens TaxID=106592 RepID=UPI0023A91AA4|nr:DUF4274 domain-containing protein [Ensifer adhaerens]WDZ78606.1 hypothetical protein PWG15_09005 [Ensifer adhaerens]
MRIETLFWSAVVVLAVALLIYRHVSRRKSNAALGRFTEAYDAARRRLIADPQAVTLGAQTDYAVLTVIEAITENRGGGAPPALADLSPRELRAVELAHAATIMTDRQFDKALRRLSAKEHTVFRQLRGLSQEQPVTSGVHARAGHPDAGERSGAKVEHAAERVTTKEQNGRTFDRLQIAGILNWLETAAPRDPDMWHLLADLNWDYPEIYDILLWVASQPECDASTALLILQLMQPDVAMDKAAGGLRWRTAGDADPAASSEVRLLAMIGKRSEDESFVRRELAPDRLCSPEANAALLDMMLGEKQRIEGDGRKLPFLLAVKLLTKPALLTGRRPKTDFEVRDDCLLVPAALRPTL